MNSVQNSGYPSSPRLETGGHGGGFSTMKRNHNSATISNNSSSSSLGSPNSTTTTSNNVDQPHFLFHAPDPHHASLDPHPHPHPSLIDFRGGSLLTFDHHPSTAGCWEDFNGGWDGPMANNGGHPPPDPSTQEFNAAFHATAKDTPKRPNLGESQQPQKKQCSSSGSAATNSKPTANKTAAKSLLESKDPQSIAAKNRRERISERLKTLQELVPNGSKVDLVTMLEKAISYVKFLQLQVKVLATDEFWPAQGTKAPDISQVKEAIDAILSTQRARKSSSSNSS